MKTIFAWLTLSLLGTVTLFGIDANDCETMKQMIEETAEVWNVKAGRGFGKYFSEDASFVNIFGIVITGKEEIEKHHIKALSSYLKDSKLFFEEVKIQEVREEVAIAFAYWKLSGPPKTPLGKRPQKGVLTHTFVKNNSQWEVVLCHGTATHSH